MEDKNFMLLTIVAIVAITSIVVMIGFTRTSGAAIRMPSGIAASNYNSNNHMVNICRVETIEKNGITCRVSVCYGDEITVGDDAVCYTSDGQMINPYDQSKRTR